MMIVMSDYTAVLTLSENNCKEEAQLETRAFRLGHEEE